MSESKNKKRGTKKQTSKTTTKKKNTKTPIKNKKITNSKAHTKTNKTKKKNKKVFKGFTLIELLATITIIGILSVTAIPAVSSIIENSRRSTYADVALKYIQAVRQSVTQDEIVCGSSSISSMPSDSYYFIRFDSTSNSGKDLMETGGKSPYGNGDVKGVVMIYKGTTDNKYAIAIVDKEGRGFGNFQGNGYSIHSFVSEERLKKENVMQKTVYGDRYFESFDSYQTAQFPSGYFCIDQNYRCPDEYHISRVTECNLR